MAVVAFLMAFFIYLVVVVPCGLAVGTFILTRAVGIVNGVVGGRHPTDSDYEFRDGSNIPVLKSRDGLLIPAPAPGFAFGLVLINFLLDFLIQLVVTVVLLGIAVSTLSTPTGASKAMAQMAGFTVVLISVPISLLVRLLLWSEGLGTTVGKAALVIVFEVVLWIAVGLVAVVGLIVFGVSLGGVMHGLSK